MSVRMTLNEFTEQFQEADRENLPCDPTDELDNILKFDVPFTEGWSRRIKLREGIQLEIDQNQIRERMMLTYPEIADHYICCEFLLSGSEQWKTAPVNGETSWINTTGRYTLCSSGSRDLLTIDYSAGFYSAIWIEVHRKIFRSFASSSEETLPKYLQHLFGSIDQGIHRYFGDIQPLMATALQQILNCPYRGLIKRVYIESKVIELLALVLADEAAIQQGQVQQLELKPEQLERIHYAKEILLREMYNPPSLAELARQVGLNDFLLKKGFRQVFGNTVFGELQAHRLELAKQLLLEGSLSAGEISRLAGYASPNSFARAFRQKFGLTPTTYRKAGRLT